MKVGVLYSGGKDSNMAALLAREQGHELACLISMKCGNPHSYMFHTPNIDLVELQSEAMNIPLVFGYSDGRKEKEVDDLKKFVGMAKEQYSIKGLVVGALASEYQKVRVEKICKDLGLKAISPLWGVNPEAYVQSLIRRGFSIVIVGVAADGLDRSWLGRKVDNKFLKDVKEANAKFGVHIGFEGGEFESFVTDCPLFKRKVRLIEGKVMMDGEHSGVLKVVKAKLEEKEA